MPRIAARTGAWILPGLTYRTHDHQIMIEIRPPIVPEPGETEEELMERCVPELEAIIRAHPDQWSSFFNSVEQDPPPGAWQHRRNRKPLRASCQDGAGRLDEDRFLQETWFL